MPKYIVRPGQKVTHGDHDAAMKQAQKFATTTILAQPAPPLEDFHEGDEIELTEDEAAAMAHAVCTPDEYAQLSSPKYLMDKGYTKDEAESMVASRKADADARKAKKGARAKQSPAAWGMSPPNLEDQGAEVNPRAAAKFPGEENKPHRK